MSHQELAPAARPPFRRQHTWKSADGLTLTATTWTPAVSRANVLPVLCLSGLSRNTRDFESLAHETATRGYPVVAMDYRGRGRSAHDPDWRNYSVEREADDIDRGLVALGLDRVVVVGTSRGGLHALLLAARHPQRVAGLVLNDVGPRLEVAGLRRLCRTIGQDMTARDWADAANRLRDMLEDQFPALDAPGWLRLARQVYIETPDGLRLDYDDALRHSLADFDPDTAVPDFWPVFDALADIPMLFLRGAHSDILSEETLAEMLRRRPRAQAITVADEGHAPLLWDRPTQTAILAFIEGCA